MKLRILFVMFALFCISGLTLAQTKKGPGRDPKTGRFMKKEIKADGTIAKKGPARDPKTGRFIKSIKPTGTSSKMTSGGKMTKAPAKKMPARDPKTGRFMKSDKK